MKKILNNPADYVDEMLEGWLLLIPIAMPCLTTACLPALRGPKRARSELYLAAAPDICRCLQDIPAGAFLTQSPSAMCLPLRQPSRWPTA